MDSRQSCQGGILESIAPLLHEGNLPQALELAEAALAGSGDPTEAICALAVIAARQGRIASAIELFEKVLDLPGRPADVPEVLAVLQCLAGNVADALYYAKLSTTVPQDGHLLALFGPGFPQFAAAFAQMGHKPMMRQARDLADAGKYEAALAQVEQHLQLNRADVEALDLHSLILCQLGRYTEAIAVLRSVLTMAGPSATLMSRLGDCLLKSGELEEAVSLHRAAVRRAPKAQSLWAAMLHCWSYAPFSDGAAWSEALAAWDDLLTEGAPKTTRPFPPAAGKDRLCVAFLCSALHAPETRRLIGRLAGGFDRKTTKVVGFGRGELADPANLFYRGAFDRWRNTDKVDELTLAQLARGEGVDVLIDADGLLATERFSLFSRKAAPLQFAWLGGGRGWMAPGAHGDLAREPGLGCGALLLERATAAATGLPAATAGRITFGADVALAELNMEVVRVWSEILHAVPESVLVLADRGLSGTPAIDRLVDRFGNLGVAHRIEVAEALEGGGFFEQVDIALAPFPVARPAPAGAALSLGVPVIAHAAGGAAVLAATLARALPEGERMVSGTLAGYVDNAVAWAADIAALAKFREEAPAKLATSPVFDANAFAAEWERFFRARLASTRGE
ncbi:MAG: tetratricopeptide repeat protein [Solirubrobacterales bacterium]